MAAASGEDEGKALEDLAYAAKVRQSNRMIPDGGFDG
jgi:hypothetical protein